MISIILKTTYCTHINQYSQFTNDNVDVVDHDKDDDADNIVVDDDDIISSNYS